MNTHRQSLLISGLRNLQRQIRIEEADRQTIEIPIAITGQVSLRGNKALAAKDSECFDALERAGFRVERFGDLWKLVSETRGGHYMNVGCSAKVAAGLVRKTDPKDLAPRKPIVANT